jgi:hypothetical protein
MQPDTDRLLAGTTFCTPCTMDLSGGVVLRPAVAGHDHRWRLEASRSVRLERGRWVLVWHWPVLQPRGSGLAPVLRTLDLLAGAVREQRMTSGMSGLRTGVVSGGRLIANELIRLGVPVEPVRSRTSESPETPGRFQFAITHPDPRYVRDRE